MRPSTSPEFSDVSAGIGTRRGSTPGTCTVANSTASLCFSSFLLESSAAMLSVLLRISGNGRDASTAIGVNTG